MVAELSLLSRMFDFMSQQPSAEEITQMKTTEEEDDRLDYLSIKSHNNQLSDEESDELKEYLLAQHLMIIAKANALGKLKRQAS
jgi:hypothetical protein